MCSCNTEIEGKEHFLLSCHFYSSQKLKLWENRNKINSSSFKLKAKEQVNILLYGYSLNNPISLIYIYIYIFHLSVLSDSVNCNLCNFLLII